MGKFVDEKRIELSFSKGRLRISCIEAGDPGGPLLLLIHGLCCSAEFWKHLLEDPFLLEKTRLLALDLPGHGLSDKPGWLDYSMAEFSDVAMALLDRLGCAGPSAVAGFSMGAPIAIELFRKSGAERLILVEPVLTAKDVPITRVLARVPVPILGVIKGLALAFPRVLASVYLCRREPSAVSVIKRACRLMPCRVFRKCSAELVRSACDPRTYQDFKSIDAEKRVIVRGDVNMPGFQPPADLDSHALMETIPKSGHAVMLDNPPAFIRAVRRAVSDGETPS